MPLLSATVIPGKACLVVANGNQMSENYISTVSNFSASKHCTGKSEIVIFGSCQITRLRCVIYAKWVDPDHTKQTTLPRIFGSGEGTEISG